ncbi:hypothetical protein ACGF5H_17060 [Micromonospora chalcea]|uniref:hypothetical protein n=1 Tax=Micromonospora sp. TSRI0369 TaxID=1703936 RepID=UPI00093F3A7C|nr:hypothetical protein [Micromonospora sp. TSRI0369]OKJ33969.1 hypothetical protein AMK25_29755 [Micromonospora sp. TSRI0369]
MGRVEQVVSPDTADPRAGAESPYPLVWLRGGPEESRSLVQGLELVRHVAAGDVAEGWLCMIANGTAHYLSTFASDELLDRTYARDNQVFGVVAPVGVLRPDGDGTARIDGRWRFASGADRATYLAMGCVPVEGRRRSALLRRDLLRVDEPWAGPGLLATTSHTLRADDVHVDETDVVDLTDVPSDRPTGIYGDGELFLANMPGVPLGLAEGLLALLGPTVTGTSAWATTYSDAYSRCVLARHGVTDMLRDLDTLARNGRLKPFAPPLRAEFRALLSGAYHVALDAVLALAAACDTADPALRARLVTARRDGETMRPHGAMRSYLHGRSG